MLVVDADLELKVEAVLFFLGIYLFFFLQFHCLHMLPLLMVCSVTGPAYPATAVVPCVEFNFSNAIGLDEPPALAAGKCPLTVM